MPADLLIYIIIAAILVFWLKNTLGTRTGEEQERPNPFSPPAPPSSDAQPESISTGGQAFGMGFRKQGSRLDKAINTLSISNDARQALIKISEKNIGFTVSKFVDNVKEAFVITVEAYAEGDRETLKQLVTNDVYAAFDKVISAHEKRGERIETEVHALREAVITDAVLKGKEAFIAVRITAEETVATYDKNNKVIHGHPDHMITLSDIWVFTRNLDSRDPTWRLAETRDGDVEEAYKTVPNTNKDDKVGATSDSVH